VLPIGVAAVLLPSNTGSALFFVVKLPALSSVLPGL
jgi:hypothetical protein